MIYPQKIKAKQTDKLVKILISLSIGIALAIVIINKLTTPNIPWAALVNSGILYTWITVLYSIKKNINIAGHVLWQTIVLCFLSIYVDYQLGFKGWSINIGVPIMIMIANITMLVLAIVSHKKFFKYVISQFILVAFSMLPIIFLTEHMVRNQTLSVLASSISILNLMICLILCTKEIKDAMIRKFHL